MTGLRLRALTAADFDAFATVVVEAFLGERSEAHDAAERAVFEPGRAQAVYDGDRLAGTGAILTRDLTLPGAGPTPVAAVTAVGVLPDARRRGVLTTIMREQLDLLHTTGAEPVAALWASQFPLYGRYGYGPATTAVRVEVPGGAGFRRDVDTDGRIEVVGTPPPENPAVRAVYAAVSRARRLALPRRRALERPVPGRARRPRRGERSAHRGAPLSRAMHGDEQPHCPEVF